MLDNFQGWKNKRDEEFLLDVVGLRDSLTLRPPVRSRSGLLPEIKLPDYRSYRPCQPADGRLDARPWNADAGFTIEQRSFRELPFRHGDGRYEDEGS